MKHPSPGPGPRNARSPRFAAAAIFAALVPTFAAAAQPAAPAGDAQDLVKTRLVTESAGLQPGQTSHLGIVFEIEPGWHLYWQNSGDTGIPIGIDLILPEGFTAGEIQWPPPKRHVHTGLIDFILEDRVTLIIPIHVPADARIGSTAAIRAKLDWLVCKEECRFGDAEVQLEAPIASSAAPAPEAELFAIERSRAPKPLTNADRIEIRWNADALIVDATGASRLEYFPGPQHPSAPADAAPVDIIRDGAAAGPRLQVEFTPGIQDAQRIQGVLGVEREGLTTFYKIDIPGPKADSN